MAGEPRAAAGAVGNVVAGEPAAGGGDVWLKEVSANVSDNSEAVSSFFIGD